MSTTNEGKIAKPTVSDPNLHLFTSDEWRYKAYRWYCLQRMVLKIGVILAGTITAVEGVLKLISTYIG